MVEAWTISRWLMTSIGVHTAYAAMAAETPVAAYAAGFETPSQMSAEPDELLVALSATR